ncbi:MAG: biopolymer transporter ExbD [Rubrivivax sp.]
MMSPLQRRAERKSRNQTMVDMNLVSLIDVFTILIFFLLSSAGVETALPSLKSVQLPQSTAEKSPKETLAVIVSAQEIVVEGRQVASVPEVMAQQADLIPGLQAELKLLAQRQTVRAENKEAEKALTIVADKDIPYRLLRKVMVTGSQSGFSDVSFAVRKRGDL